MITFSLVTVIIIMIMNQGSWIMNIIMIMIIIDH